MLVNQIVGSIMSGPRAVFAVLIPPTYGVLSYAMIIAQQWQSYPH